MSDSFNDTVTRSDDACSECQGEGLTFIRPSGERCVVCAGTGIAQPTLIDGKSFKPGTQVLTKDGTFIISPDGEAIKQ